MHYYPNHRYISKCNNRLSQRCIFFFFKLNTDIEILIYTILTKLHFFFYPSLLYRIFSFYLPFGEILDTGIIRNTPIGYYNN